MNEEKELLVEKLDEKLEKYFTEKWDDRTLFTVVPLIYTCFLVGVALTYCLIDLIFDGKVEYFFIVVVLTIAFSFLFYYAKEGSVEKRKRKYIDNKISKLQEEDYLEIFGDVGGYLEFISLRMLQEGKKFDLNRYSEQFKYQRKCLELVLFCLNEKAEGSSSKERFELVELFLDGNLENEFLIEIFNSIFVFKLPISLVKTFLDRGYSIEEIKKEQQKFQPIVEKENETKIEENDTNESFKNENEESEVEKNVFEMAFRLHNKEVFEDKEVITPLDLRKIPLECYKKVKSPKEMEKIIKLFQQDVDLKCFFESGRGFTYLETSKLRDIDQMNRDNVLKLIKLTKFKPGMEIGALDLLKEK